MLTDRLVRSAPSSNVFLLSYDLKMGRIVTRAIATQMIDLQISRDRTHQGFVDHSMHQDCPSFDTSHPIPIPQASLVRPTLSVDVHALGGRITLIGSLGLREKSRNVYRSRPATAPRISALGLPAISARRFTTSTSLV